MLKEAIVKLIRKVISRSSPASNKPYVDLTSLIQNKHAQGIKIGNWREVK